MSSPDSLCVSFKKRLTKYNALDQSEGAVVEEHYCALFEERCPVIGATAKAPECLRNQKNSVTKDPADTTITKNVREHVDGAPGNTFTTVLTKPVMSKDSAGTVPLVARAEQITRLREEAQSLRNSLREYEIETEKKNS